MNTPRATPIVINHLLPGEFMEAAEKLNNQEEINHPNSMAINKEPQKI
jgi:hypothetical protein